MKLIFTSLVVLCLSTTIAKSQVILDTISNNFPDFVVMKVQDVVFAANIASAEQLPLANFFLYEGRVIDSASINNATPTQIEAIQTQLVTQFQSILSSQELTLFSTNRQSSIYAITPPASTTGQ